MAITIFGGAGGGANANKITHLTADGDTLGLWTFDGDLNDSSGNARHFTTGTYDKYPLNPVGGEMCHRTGATDIYQTTAALRLTGAVSGGMLIYLTALPATNVPLFGSFNVGGGAGEANNFLYTVEVTAAGKLQYQHHYGAGQTLETFTSALDVPVDEWCWVAFSRSTAGTTVKLCVNDATETDTTIANAPTGGGNNEFQCCTKYDGTNVTALISNLIIKNVEVADLVALGRLTNLGF
jgi:hypothetical protein